MHRNKVQRKILCVLLIIAVFNVTSWACSPPTLPPGGTWNANQGCTRGGFYRSGTNRCHCWGHCGYICEPDKGSPCPFGGVWRNPKGQRCYCQSLNREPFYVCSRK